MTPTERRGRLKRLKSELFELTNAELAELLLLELDRRRLGPDGAPQETPGLYQAATTAVLAILGEDPASIVEGMIEQLAAVGRGVRVRSLVTDDAPLIRELAPLVELMKRDPGDLARTLSVRLSRACDEAAIAEALKRDTANGRVTDVLIAAGVFRLDGADGTGRNELLRRVGRALGPEWDLKVHPEF